MRPRHTWMSLGTALVGLTAHAAPGIHATITVSEVTIFWATSPNLIYQVQSCQDLTSDRWTDLGNPVTADGDLTSVEVPVGGSRCYYRVVGPDVVWIPPGDFLMGIPETEAEGGRDAIPHPVTISQGFWMTRYEVTQEEYVSIMGNNPSTFRGPYLPVEMVNWWDATNYCGRLTQRELAAQRLPEGYVYRLPSEAEWEYACRAGTTTAFHYGDELRSGMANFRGTFEYSATLGTVANPDGTFLDATTSVGRFQPNAWGLYDLHGNVWEWCQDLDAPYSGLPEIDPVGPAWGEDRVFRGGSWDSPGYGCRAAWRMSDHPGHGSDSPVIGFRVVLGRPLAEPSQD